jgi:hypothetical protein
MYKIHTRNFHLQIPSITINSILVLKPFVYDFYKRAAKIHVSKHLNFSSAWDAYAGNLNTQACNDHFMNCSIPPVVFLRVAFLRLSYSFNYKRKAKLLRLFRPDSSFCSSLRSSKCHLLLLYSVTTASHVWRFCLWVAKDFWDVSQ